MKSQIIRITFFPPSVSFYPFEVEWLEQYWEFWRLLVSKAAGWTADKHQASNQHTRALEND